MNERRLIAISGEEEKRLRWLGEWLSHGNKWAREDAPLITPLADRYEDGITEEEARVVLSAAQSDGWLAGHIRIEDGREVYPEHETVTKLRATFSHHPAHQEERNA